MRATVFDHHVDRTTKLEAADLVEAGRVGVAIDRMAAGKPEFRDDGCQALPLKKGCFNTFAVGMLANEAFSFVALGNLELGFRVTRVEAGAFAFGDVVIFAM